MDKLPFTDDGKWFLNAGNHDDPTRGHGLGQYYAFDFNHPLYGEIRAARGGIVTFVESKIDLNTYDKLPPDNICGLIRHLDNTVAGMV